MKRLAARLSMLLLFAGCVADALAVAPQVRTVLKPDSVLIGDRFSLEVVIEKDMMQVISFPEFAEGLLVPGIEIISESEPDTLTKEGRRETIRKAYELVSFDAGVYELGRYPVLYGDKNITDTLYSQSGLRVVVNTLPVDTEKSTIYDIKAPEEAPMKVSEISGYVISAFVLGCVIAALVIFLLRWLKRRRTDGREVGVPKPSIPPHVRAIQELEELNNQKLWQSGKAKQYYTRLTDIMRRYLCDRYGLNAMEMTSDEIKSAVKPFALSEKNRRDLWMMLQTADLVKFAKHVPDGEENEKLYYGAYYFVEDTKESVQEEDDKKSESDEK